MEFGSFFGGGFFPRNFFSLRLRYLIPVVLPQSQNPLTITLFFMVVKRRSSASFSSVRNRFFYSHLMTYQSLLLNPHISYSRLLDTIFNPRRVPSSPAFHSDLERRAELLFTKDVTNAVRKNSSGVDEHVCATVFYFSSRSSDEINWASLRGYRLFKNHFDYGYLSHEQAFVGFNKFAIFLAHRNFFR